MTSCASCGRRRRTVSARCPGRSRTCSRSRKRSSRSHGSAPTTSSTEVAARPSARSCSARASCGRSALSPTRPCTRLRDARSPGGPPISRVRSGSPLLSWRRAWPHDAALFMSEPMQSVQFATRAQHVSSYNELLMKATRTPALVFAVLAVLLAAACGGSSGDVPEGSVATVDGQDITKQQLDDLTTRVKTTYQANQREFPQAGTPEYQALQQQAVAFLVQRIEYQREADKLGITVTSKEIDERVAKVKKDVFKGKEAAFRQQLTAQGYTLSAFKEDVRAQILSEKLFANVSK